VLNRCLLLPKTLETQSGGRRIALISPEVTPYFSLHRLEITDRFMGNNAAEQFSVVVVLSGRGTLKWERGEIPLNQADELFIPACLDRLECHAHAGRLDLVQCFPPMSEREEVV
jgi:mannose-6-phosphate isomerase class I